MRRGAKDNTPPNNVRQGEYFFQGKGALISVSTRPRSAWLSSLSRCLKRTECTGNLEDEVIDFDEGLQRVDEMVRDAHKKGGKIIFVGNGGSAAIASHMAVDWNKNKSVRSVALNDAAMLTMLANDYGYEQVFAKQIEYHARKSDVLVIVSSSGRSLNIMAAVGAAREKQLRGIITLSGMNPNNKLRRSGNINFYVPCADYGLVEISHLAILHSVASA
jgi:D-sedoheptulose 7-phosphate isomerase